MPPANDLPSASIAMAAGLFLIAVFLGLRQWYERKAREPGLSEADRSHFFRQDVRRGLGVGVLLVIALLVLVGSRVEARVQGKANLVFLQLWVAVLALILVLLTLALADWAATRTYARRHRKQLLRESLDAIRQEARKAYSTGSESETDNSLEP